MKRDVIVNKYANALKLMAQKQTGLDMQLEEIEAIVQVFNEHKELMKVLLNPGLSAQEKENLVREIFTTVKVSPAILDFLSFLLKENRINYINEIASRYAQIVDEQNRRMTVEVETAMPLSEETKHRLSDKLKELIGMRVKLAIKINAELLGGLILRLGDRVIDSSLKRQLLELKTEMSVR